MNRKLFIAFLSGFIFAIGLAVGGMTTPGNVLGFLDVFGEWKPALAFVMGGAIAVNAPLFFLMRRRGRPLLAGRFHLPTLRDIDPRLVLGSAIFGVGWGMSGYCPGPGIIAPWGGAAAGSVFLLSMVGGIQLFGALGRMRARASMEDRVELEAR